MSHALRVRGLKRLRGVSEGLLCVARSARAWIETPLVSALAEFQVARSARAWIETVRGSL